MVSERLAGIRSLQKVLFVMVHLFMLLKCFTVKIHQVDYGIYWITTFCDNILCVMTYTFFGWVPTFFDVDENSNPALSYS